LAIPSISIQSQLTQGTATIRRSKDRDREWGVEIKVLRDRKSEFEPRVVKKRQTVLEDLQDKIIALYAKV
jgi:transposase-like protein